MKQASLAQAGWRRSSCSSGNSAYVEVAFLGDAVAVRDSKDRGPVHVFTPASGLPSSVACWTGSQQVAFRRTQPPRPTGDRPRSDG